MVGAGAKEKVVEGVVVVGQKGNMRRIRKRMNTMMTNGKVMMKLIGGMVRMVNGVSGKVRNGKTRVEGVLEAAHPNQGQRQRQR